MQTSTKAVLLGAGAVLSWSTVATAFKIALKHMTCFEMVLVSTATALMIMMIALTVMGRWGQVRTLGSRQWLALAIFGLVNPTVYYNVLFASYDLLPAQVAQPINYTWPIVLLVLLAVFNHQSIPGLKYVGMAMSLGGVACISMGASGAIGALSPVGLVLGVMSAFLWASYWLLNKRLGSNVDATVAFFGTFLFGTVYSVLAIPIFGVGHLTTDALLSGAYIGAFEMAIPFLCFGIALRITPNPTLINQMCYLSPFLSLFFISRILGEPIVLTTYIGLILIVGGIVFNEYAVTPLKRLLS